MVATTIERMVGGTAMAAAQSQHVKRQGRLARSITETAQLHELPEPHLYDEANQVTHRTSTAMVTGLHVNEAAK